ncbi:MAG: alpha-hydroxy acid oxidase [Gemmatimonadota bacterium]|nr:alpha-hydroxy acid oxidase [Gemmatimonadota bacterium]
MPPDRRAFLRFLAASPLVSAMACAERVRDDAPWVISSPEEALDVFEFREVARANLPPAHFGYIQTGVESGRTFTRNHEAYGEIQLRVRRLVDVSRVDTGVELFGRRWDTPIIIAPCGSQRAFHPDGELATARAARTHDHLQVLSTVTTTSVEDVADARGEPVWYQLYPTPDWSIARHLIERAEGAGSPALVLTVDSPAGSDRDPGERAARLDTRNCVDCHAAPYVRKPMYDGFDPDGAGGIFNPAMDWAYVARLRETTDMRIVLKGIVRSDDADRAVEEGVDAIVVSNHGGRSEESGRATIESLPEVVDAVRGRIPVIVDGGIRRGNDILKALAVGADAVQIGRPYLWGLAAFGQPGVERVLEMLTEELRLAMQFAGAPTIADITRDLLVGFGS